MEIGPRISAGGGALMVGVALFFDVLNGIVNLIPVAGQILSVCITLLAYFLLWIWFASKGVSLASPKRVVQYWGSMLPELVPFFNILPLITLGVFLTVAETKTEDAIAVHRAKKKAKRATREGGGEEGEEEEFEDNEDDGENELSTPPQLSSYEEPRA